MIAPAGPLGTGVLWRPENARVVHEEVSAGRVTFVEVIAESLRGGLPPGLTACRRAGSVIVPHGVGLGLGGVGQPDPWRLRALAGAADVCGAPLVSEHIAYVRGGGIEAGHLLPVPRSRDALDVLIANVRRAEAALPVPLALEPIATLVDWPRAELDEVSFLTELLERTGVGLVLDLANIHVNAANRRRAGATGPDADAFVLLAALPAERIAYVHAAGGTVRDGRHHDTHEHPMWPEVEALAEELWANAEPPGLLLERESRVPGPELRRELAVLEAAVARGRARRGERVPDPGPPRVVVATVPSRAARRRLHESQTRLLRAVCDRSPPPPGFAEDDIEAVAEVLTRKRAAAVMHAVPELAVTPAFRRGFTRWAREHPRTGPDARSDAERFFRYLGTAERPSRAGVAVASASLRRRVGRRRPFGITVRRIRRGVVLGAQIGRWQAVGAVGG